MFVMTERHGSSAASWNAMPRWWLRRAAAGSSPCTSACPLVGASRSARIRRIVDFPHPDGPSNVGERSRRRREVDAFERDDLRSADAEDLPELTQRDAVVGDDAEIVGRRVGSRQGVGRRHGSGRRVGLQLGVLRVHLVEHRHVEQLVLGDRDVRQRKRADVLVDQRVGDREEPVRLGVGGRDQQVLRRRLERLLGDGELLVLAVDVRRELARRWSGPSGSAASP